VERADLEHHEVERSFALADRRELRSEARVTAEEHPTPFALDDPRRPERAVAIERSTPGEVTRRRCRETEAALRQGRLLPPVELDDAIRLDPEILEPSADAERRHERHAETRELAHRRKVEMVVVVV